ncbi:DUF2613 domain-containing protein [Corynebacterium terpenotabidum]|uniref:DUF2613 domain-containing protein n=1 Tax=Corynebacterium terpenotabidum Y-11 TaxID=1200352 RepID=S4X9V7_9CORY|nr:DUF2613 domain-containing protein [Corynebacterium terpenotabidum]AGP29902.1 hypothetical protein A606_01235 [Corynebacterium terpenotabidum Y-11]
MPFETDSTPRRSIGPAIASAVIGVVLGGIAAIGIGMVADNTELPSNTVSENDAILGSVQYGERR